MKLVKEPNPINSIKPLSGCVCSSGHMNTRGPWQPIYNCNCSCNNGSKNYTANFKMAKKS